jgi:hypothetical protein
MLRLQQIGAGRAGGRGRKAMTDDETVVANFIEALLAHDLDSVMELFDERSALSVGDVTNRGRAEIRAHFERALAGSPPGSDYVYRIETDPDGRVALRWTLHSEPGGPQIASGEDYFTIEDGTIVDQLVVHHH